MIMTSIIMIELIATARYCLKGFELSLEDSPTGFNISAFDYETPIVNDKLWAGEYNLRIFTLDPHQLGLRFTDILSDNIKIIYGTKKNVTIIVEENSKEFDFLQPLKMYRLCVTGYGNYDRGRIVLSDIFYINCNREIEELNHRDIHIKLILYLWMVIGLVYDEPNDNAPFNSFVIKIKSLIEKRISNVEENFKRGEEAIFQNQMGILALISHGVKYRNVPKNEFRDWIQFLDKLDLFDFSSLDWKRHVVITRTILAILKGIFKDKIYKNTIRLFCFRHLEYYTRYIYDTNYLLDNHILKPVSKE